MSFSRLRITERHSTTAINPTPNTTQACWDSFEVPEGVLSLPRLTEKFANQIKALFIRWTQDFSEVPIKGQPLKKYLEISEGLSFWWFTLPSEKSPLKSPEIVDIFRLCTLEILDREYQWREIIYEGVSREIHQCLENWCRKTNKVYAWRCPFSFSQKMHSFFKPKRFTRALPHWLQAFLYLMRFLWLHLGILVARHPSVREKRNSSLSIATYFPNVDLELLQKGKFHSHYWGSLHGVLDQIRTGVDWIWFYNPKGGMDSWAAARYRKVCQKNTPTHRFFFVQECLSFSGLLHALARWLRLVRKSYDLRSVEDHFVLSGYQICFFPILRQSWISSLRGYTALLGCLWISMFETVGKITAGSKMGLYTWENQPWEAALIHAWRRNGTGKILGFQHSAMPPLVLRAFDHPAAFQPGPFTKPMPDFIVTNGPGSLQLMLESGVPKDRLLVAEAVRYEYLTQFRRKNVSCPERAILVTTGICRDESRRQMWLLKKALQRLQSPFQTVYLKPHPFFSTDRFLTKELIPPGLKVVDWKIEEAVSFVECVFCANMSAVAVETFCAGLPTAVHVPPDALNLSPLFNHAGVTMIYTEQDLQRFLDGPWADRQSEPYFDLHRDLPKWKGLLGEILP